MVTNGLEVKTYRDPDCGPTLTYADSQLPGAEEHRARRLQLHVPAVNRQFVVKDIMDDFEVGTEVTLTVSKKMTLLPNSEVNDPGTAHSEENSSDAEYERTLRITEYLCDIAGFVEFPIYIEESLPGKTESRITLILHPDRNPETERALYEESVVIHQLSRDYPWEVAVDPESIGVCREHMTVNRVELKELLGDRGYEGWLTFPEPEVCDFAVRESRYGYSQRISLRKQEDGKWADYSILMSEDVDSNDVPPTLVGIYRDGIRLKKQSLQPILNRYIHDVELPTPQVLINLSSTEASRTNISRTSLWESEEGWFDTILAEIKKLVSEKLLCDMDLPPVERIYRIGWLGKVFRIQPHEMRELVPDENKLTVWLVAPGALEFREGRLPTEEEIPDIPNQLNDVVFNSLAEAMGFNTILKTEYEWEGPKSKLASAWADLLYREPYSIPLRQGIMYAVRWSTTVKLRVHWLEPPKVQNDLIMQSIGILDNSALAKIPYYELSENERKRVDQDIDMAIEMAIDDPYKIQAEQLALISFAYQDDFDYSFRFALPVPFATPFQQCLFFQLNAEFGKQIITNKSSDVGVALFQALAALLLASRKGRLRTAVVHEFYEEVNLHRFESDPIEPRSFATNLFRLVKEYSLIDGFTPPLIPDHPDMVPEMKVEGREVSELHDSDIMGKAEYAMGTFGRIITEYPGPKQTARKK